MRSKGVVWFGFILLLASMIPNLMQAYIVYAQSSDEARETIIQTDTLKVTTNVKQVNDQMRWELQYQWSTPTENSARRLKLKFYDNEGKAEKNVDTSLVQPEHIDGWRLNENNWFMNEEFKTSAEGTVVVMTALSVKNLALRIQLDEEIIKEVERVKETISSEELSASQESSGSSEVVTTFNNETEVEVIEEKIITEDILQTPDADVHELSAPEIDAPVTSSSEVKDTSQEEMVTPSEETSETTVESQVTETSEIESSPSETSSSSEETKSNKEPNLNRYITTAPGFIDSLSLVQPFANGVSPFQYTSNATEGTFPTHWTDKYLPGNSTSTQIRNFNYGAQQNPVATSPKLKNIIADPLTFAGGYHSYEFGAGLTDVLLKKTVKPTADSSKFEIELDAIGGTNRTVNQIDVVFVVDKSGSMSGTKWTNLKTELAKFAKGLVEASFTPGDIKMGLVSFSDTVDDNIYTPYTRIADFSTTPSDGVNSGITGFTSDFRKLDGNDSTNRHPILATDPVGGTALFLGIDAGIELLKNTNYGARSTARKVLIVLSDGVATYAPNTARYGSQAALQNLAKSKQNSNRSLQFSTTRGSTQEFVGDGLETDANLLGGTGQTNVIGLTNSFINNRRTNFINALPILPISIGFGLSGNYVTQARGILRNLAGSSTTDPNSNFFDAAVDNLGVALDKVKTLILTLNDVVRDGILTDPMSQYVTFQSGTLKRYALTYNTTAKTLTTIAVDGNSSAPEYAKNAIVDQTNSPLKVTNLYLGGVDNLRYGYRITYTVQLKEEYQDGLFYPANERTTLDAYNITNSLDFAIPSVKKEATTFDIPVTKEWIDDNNTWTTRQSISLQLQKKVGTTWVDVAGKSITLPVGTTSYTFTGIQAYESGLKIDYAIKETPTRVTGYKAPVYTPASVNISSTNKTLKVTNELLKTKIEFTKVKSDGTTPLAGVGFTLFKANGTTAIGTQVLSDATGKVSFPTQLPIGSYVVKETLTLPGYEPIDPMNLVVSDTNATLSVTGFPTVNKVVNRLKDFKLIVKKLDTVGNAVNGAKFKLESTTTSPPYSNELSSSNNLFEFTGLKPGTYTLTETQTPDGYIGLQNPITIMIDLDGNVKVDDVSQPGVITGEGNIIKLDVKNRQKGQLPSTGGNGTQQYLIATFVLASIASVIGIYYVYRNRKGAK